MDGSPQSDVTKHSLCLALYSSFSPLCQSLRGRLCSCSCAILCWNGCFLVLLCLLFISRNGLPLSVGFFNSLRLEHLWKSKRLPLGPSFTVSHLRAGRSFCPTCSHSHPLPLLSLRPCLPLPCNTVSPRVLKRTGNLPFCCFCQEVIFKSKQKLLPSPHGRNTASLKPLTRPAWDWWLEPFTSPIVLEQMCQVFSCP